MAGRRASDAALALIGALFSTSLTAKDAKPVVAAVRQTTISHVRYVSYFSSEGARLTKRRHIPKPPVKLLKLLEVDPPRNVPAEKWNSAFCLTWDDGCTECRRARVGDEASCNPRERPDSGQTCKPKNVACTSDFQLPDLTAVCSRIDLTKLVEYDNGRKQNYSGSSDISWRFHLENEKPAWDYYVADEYSIPSAPALAEQQSIKMIRHEKDFVCKASFQGGMRDNIFILKRQ